MIDYAQASLLVEQRLKKTYAAALGKDYDAAIANAMELVVESRALAMSLRYMKEREDALRKQTQTV